MEHRLSEHRPLNDRLTEHVPETKFKHSRLLVEQQEESDFVQLLSLNQIRDLAARKRLPSLKQKEMDFFF